MTLEALRGTVQLANERNMGDVDYDNPYADYVYLTKILDTCVFEGLTGQQVMYWLGYVQAVIVAYQIATAEELAEINKKWNVNPTSNQINL